MTIILDLSPSTRVTLAPECFQNQCVLSKPKSFWNKMKSIIHISGPGEATILDLDFFWTWSSHWITKHFQTNFTTRSWKLGEGKRKRFTSAAHPSFSPAILTGCGPYMFSRKPYWDNLRNFQAHQAPNFWSRIYLKERPNNFRKPAWVECAGRRTISFFVQPSTARVWGQQCASATQPDAQCEPFCTAAHLRAFHPPASP